MKIDTMDTMKISSKIKKNTRIQTWGMAAIFALAGLSSCDPLGIEPTTVVDEDVFWTSSLLSRSYINNFYTWKPATATDRFTSEQWSDNAIGNLSTDWTDWKYKKSGN